MFCETRTRMTSNDRLLVPVGSAIGAMVPRSRILAGNSPVMMLSEEYMSAVHLQKTRVWTTCMREATIQFVAVAYVQSG